ncbi:tRNA uridine-5-carboxymethylaminomethyl(34) synthesis GTPase MnmE [Roseovarius nubinhibens]|uniref:tRNA uridine-5-carboxymethylaminomethyl(34) synthesis GTPase MnmE n=1 Tax=Roseovarius nubinhibens TaxID=314263 RepID=UPI001C0A55E5|nr:tRNA uridine-5-carboxymethylaminomethyl(34) synthesis GTPase MnmE [Roseovarius nubinhibens]MBU2999291.1 tRNA uridine-5-carboxymethylaminomethyl(34) synthesis GTPase MnmE [Roseovarius nubinhibens]
MDTIFALSSAPGKAGVSVVRVSGPAAFEACRVLAGDVPARRVGSVRLLRQGEEVLDEALILTFDAGHSFTGEETVEFQVHGSVAIIGALLARLGEMPGLRQAEPGEFTRRALENERLDLAQIEGLADLLESETEAQRRQAMKMFSGALGQKAEGWRGKLIRAMALLEVTIDFADEEVPEDVYPEVIAVLDGVMAELRVEITGVAAAERIRTGFEVAIVGAPNVGKSTLLNGLAGRDAAITSDVAGTTRDVIEVRMDVAGLPVTFLDTAGLRETKDVVESVGIARAKERAAQADLRVFLLDDPSHGAELAEEGDILLQAKADVAGGGFPGVSGKTGAGIAELIAAISERLSSRVAHAGVATHLRHKRALQEGCDALEQARDLMLQKVEMSEIVAEEIRRAVYALDSLVGRVDVEAILDEVFSSFCLGK